MRWRLWWTRLWVVVVSVVVSVSAGMMFLHIINEDFEGAEQDIVEMPPPCELSMTCESLHNPDDEALDQADD